LKVNSADKLESGFKDAVKAGSGALAGTAGALLGSIQRQIINPLFVSPLAKGEIEWGFWIPAFAGMTPGALRRIE
jgi:hypothetical protein